MDLLKFFKRPLNSSRGIEALYGNYGVDSYLKKARKGGTLNFSVSI